jgi:hypothetical protein
LPVPDFKECARILDYRRLGKQRVEAYQILNTLRGESLGWRNHPAVKMWAGYEPALKQYGREMCLEWRARGYKDNMLERFVLNAPVVLPTWLGDSRLHISHQSNLIRKDPEYYKDKFPNVPADLPYFWITKG